jgi:hypothetical protein
MSGFITPTLRYIEANSAGHMPYDEELVDLLPAPVESLSPISIAKCEEIAAQLIAAGCVQVDESRGLIVFRGRWQWLHAARPVIAELAKTRTGVAFQHINPFSYGPSPASAPTHPSLHQ